ncbi:MAG TPA: HNH endonuclease family protein, partial [Candidatus Desulfobacillus denitrificans]|nr:HNH endonuclease family protein [Candidatus Desulfobacillus denitrificans]HNT62820.1 HNH endonuclease family protein [Candidatus Desulfobacillus denitrificans]
KLDENYPSRWVNSGWTSTASVVLWTADANDPRAIATRERNSALQTFGNLTILSQALNSAASNASWSEKKPELLRHSLLPINQQLHETTVWDEAAIQERSAALFERALKLWPRE